MTKKSGLDWVILAGCDLEDANHHSIVNIPEELYESLKSIVQEEDYNELGKIIYMAFRNV